MVTATTLPQRGPLPAVRGALGHAPSLRWPAAAGAPRCRARSLAIRGPAPNDVAPRHRPGPGHGPRRPPPRPPHRRPHHRQLGAPATCNGLDRRRRARRDAAPVSPGPARARRGVEPRARAPRSSTSSGPGSRWPSSPADVVRVSWGPGPAPVPYAIAGDIPGPVP